MEPPTPPPEDLPQMWQKPAFEDLFSCLLSLRVEPPVWGSRTSSRSKIQQPQQKQYDIWNPNQVSTFLSSIVGSRLKWIKDDDQKEQIWTEASRRVSERCGRWAMGEITRRWPFDHGDDGKSFELVIREPPLTGDDLGLKTWGSSYVLAQMLHGFGKGPDGAFSHLLDEERRRGGDIQAVELGSGTGLLGLAAAAVWGVAVSLSDLPAIVPDLAHNVELNRAVVESLGGSVAAGALTWGGSGDEEVDPFLFPVKNKFKIVLVADPLYDDNHPALLVSAIDDQMACDPEARALVMVPQRDATTIGLLAAFRRYMAVPRRENGPFVCIQEGVASGQDDWGDDGANEDDDFDDSDNDEDNEAKGAKNVKCWWGVFQRLPAFS